MEEKQFLKKIKYHQLKNLVGLDLNNYLDCSNIFCIFAAKLTFIYVCCNYFNRIYNCSHLPVCKNDGEQMALGMGKHRKTIDELFLCYFCEESDY